MDLGDAADDLAVQVVQRSSAVNSAMVPWQQLHQGGDWAMQAFGSMGFSQIALLTQFYAYERHLRIAYGTDEVHRNAIAKQELAAYL